MALVGALLVILVIISKRILFSLQYIWIALVVDIVGLALVLLGIRLMCLLGFLL